MDYENDIIKEYLNSMILHPISPEEVKCPENYFYKWNADDEFLTKKHTVSIEKSPTKDFVILNLADIQCHDAGAFSEVGDFYEETIDKLIKKTKPDLITLTGDNAFDSLAHLKLIDFLESYEIPWAPVMGNADHEGCVSEFWLAYKLSNAKHCLFKCGPMENGLRQLYHQYKRKRQACSHAFYDGYPPRG